MRSFVAALMLCFACTGALASEVMVGMASIDFGRVTKWDGGRFHGFVATGHRFKASALAVAHRTLPLQSCLMVQYRDRVQLAVVDDRGPCLTPHCQRTAPERIRNRVLDMTPAVAASLHFPGLGQVSFWRVSCHS